jgi:hypothetical protein
MSGIAADYLSGMEREAIVRAERRRQAVEALEFERARADALRERLETIVVELDGAMLDEPIFAAMTPEDVEVVRPALYDLSLEDAEDEWAAGGDDDAEADAEAARAEKESEIARLEHEIAGSRRRQQAFERYLAALAG